MISRLSMDAVKLSCAAHLRQPQIGDFRELRQADRKLIICCNYLCTIFIPSLKAEGNLFARIGRHDHDLSHIKRPRMLHQCYLSACARVAGELPVPSEDETKITEIRDQRS